MFLNIRILVIKKWIKNERIVYKDDKMTKSYKKNNIKLWKCVVKVVGNQRKKFEVIKRNSNKSNILQE